MKNIAVLLGGTSSEHEISLRTGIFILRTLSPLHNVWPVLITRSGEWIYPENHSSIIPDYFIQNQSSFLADEFEQTFKKEYSPEISPSKPKLPLGIDLAFLGLHGGEGEDGTIQGFLKILGIPFTGSGVTASALAMDKSAANCIFRENGFHVANFQRLDKQNFMLDTENFFKTIKVSFPAFLKPNFGGSSVGAGKVETIKELQDKVVDLFRYESVLILQELIEGVEVSCAVLDKKKSNGRFIPQPLIPTEIIPQGKFFDYDSKYKSGKTKEITPARLTEEHTLHIRNLSLKAHQSLNCKGYSRTDFIIRNDGKIFILETNTLPGMTATSLLPQQANHCGISMKEVLETLIERALEEQEEGET